jgi:prolyl-tRNA synthetase
MKDLYTFDYSPEMALVTYESVRKAYAAFFDELKVPYLVADADSGNMGGNLSHEYHFASPIGEDHVMSCNTCDYVANEELAEKGIGSSAGHVLNATKWIGISKDRSTAVHVYIPNTPSATDRDSTTEMPAHLNIQAVSAVYPALGTSLELVPEDLIFQTVSNTVHILDYRVSPDAVGALSPSSQVIKTHPKTGKLLDLTRIEVNDPCPRCTTGTLKIDRAIEVGHTFHLGTRYSEPLKATVSVPSQGSTSLVTLQMGCHGIGMSRLIAAVASKKATESELSWPRAIAPFECIIIAAKGAEEDAEKLYDDLSGAEGMEDHVDSIIDDRSIKDFPFGWKMVDADLIGYPISLRLGREWKQAKKVEIECKAAGVRENVEFEGVKQRVLELLAGL